MSDFELEEWEVPPGTQGRIWPTFEIEVEPFGERNIVSVCVVPYGTSYDAVLFRLHKWPHITYMVFERSSVPIPRFLRRGDNRLKAEESVREALARRELKFGRAFFFQEEPECALVTASFAYWWHPRSRASAFRLPAFAQSNSHYSSQMMFNFLVDARENPDSESHFALLWQSKSKVEHLQTVEKMCPQLIELQVLMREILRGVPDLFKDYEEINWILMGDKNYVFHRSSIKENRFDDPRESPASVVEWNRFLSNRFLPFPALDKEITPLCLLERYDFYTQCIQALVEKPTQHERLEARLRLREWLERNAPDEIERLLPE